jgi:hypothetical protein
MSEQIAKLEGEVEALFELILRAHARFIFLRPLMSNKDLLNRIAKEAKGVGFRRLRNWLYWALVHELAKICSDATTRSRMEPRGRERHRWAKPRGRMELWEKRHRRQSREGSGEEAGTRPSFKQAGATESKLSGFNGSPITFAIAQMSNI